ncbi:hypothetical protein [uncultured Halorubrum sp.]|jgi:hypothetical protein|uniref:hypothetical protein n=1 Tax=uncultured Halorubrum sp. TaxID=399555 RepID=UPI002605AB67|nr:hypothetical protein [uncultured Halorubrum sp.]
MTPPASGSLDPGGIDVEAVDSIDGPRLRPTASASDRPSPGGRPEAARGDADVYATDVDPSAERVRALEAEVAALEAEVAALEAEVESKERQRQQVIDTYESIVEADRVTDPAPESTPDDSAETAGWQPLAAVASRVRRVAARLRRWRT